MSDRSPTDPRTRSGPGDGAALQRRTVVRAGAAFGIVASLRLPTATAAASTEEPAPTVSFTTGFELSDSRTTTNLNAWGLTLSPNVSAPAGSGTPPGTGSVRLLSLTVLFSGGSGSKESVISPLRDVALYPTLARRSGASVTDDAVGGVISRWTDASASAGSGTDTWMRFEFLAGPVLLDVGTEYFVGLISSDTAFTNGTMLRGAQSTGAGTYLVNSTPGRNTSYQILARGSFA